jgi:hypothetical protein
MENTAKSISPALKLGAHASPQDNAAAGKAVRQRLPREQLGV